MDYRRLLGTGKRKTQLLKYCMQCYISNLRSRTPCMRPQCVPKLDLFLLRPELKGIVIVFVFRWKVKSYLQKKKKNIAYYFAIEMAGKVPGECVQLIESYYSIVKLLMLAGEEQVSGLMRRSSDRPPGATGIRRQSVSHSKL